MERRHTVRIAMVVLMQALAAQAAVVVVDDFEAGLSAWTIDGSVRSVTQAGNQIAALEEPGAGSRSRLYRPDIAVPTTPTHLSFRYYFSSAPGTRDTAVPPDSFSAYFTDAAGGRLIVPGGTSDPKFSSAFFYADSDGELLYDPAYVTVSTQRDADGLYAVALRVPSIGAAGPLRIEFGLDCAGNGITSFGLVDDVQFGCSSAFCCDPATGLPTMIDDRDPCTEDSCVNNEVQHETIPCCEGCYDGSAGEVQLVIMADASSSIGQSGFVAIRDAVVAMLDYFEAYPERPSIALGRISDQGTICLGNDCLPRLFTGHLDTNLNDNYDAIRTFIQSGNFTYDESSRTPLSEAIDAAVAVHEQQGNPNNRRYLVLITDGWANEDDNGQCTSGTTVCNCSVAKAAAAQSATTAQETKGMRIMVSHFVGVGSTACNNAAQRASAIEFLQNEIASSTTDFREDDLVVENDSLACALVEFAQLVNCQGTCVDGECVPD